ncbi:hypothetical protein HOY82DRAFT_537791 [Tuber indicum]|nr:hypothetical protein HOY82DRAFT_537791 [Tuber indicum]
MPPVDRSGWRNTYIFDSKNTTAVLGGFYTTEGSIVITDETPLHRTKSLKTGTRVGSFREAVRERDRRCVITWKWVLLPQEDRWIGFEACHIFPLAHQAYWEDKKLDAWITIPPDNESHGRINSVQNVILLKNEVHAFFDAYELSINPDA